MLGKIKSFFKNNKKDNNNSVTDKAIDVAKKKAIMMAAAPVMSGCSFLILPIIIGFFILFITLSPLTAVNNAIDKVEKLIFNFSDQLTTFLTSGELGGAEKKYYTDLEKQYNIYMDYEFKEDDFNYPLLSSTINHNVVMSSAKIATVDEGEDVTTTGGENTGLTIVADKDVPSFYRWAASKLGTIKNDNGLIGALVGRRIKSVCLDHDSLSIGDKLSGGLLGIAGDFASQILGIAGNFNPLVVVRTVLGSLQALSDENDRICNYYDKNCDSGGKGFFNLINKAAEDIKLQFESFKEYFDFSQVDWNLKCADNQYVGVRMFYFMDYERYNEYLADTYIPPYYIDCPNCLNNNVAEDDTVERDKLINKEIKIIYSRAKYWEYIFDKHFTGHHTPVHGDATVTNCKDGGEYVPRNSEPDNSEFWNFSSGLKGQCTWYAAGRANEILAQNGSDFRIRGWNDAKLWCNNPNITGGNGLSTGMEPKVGAILVLGATPENSHGHVAIVEEVLEDGTIKTSESNQLKRDANDNLYQDKKFFARTLSPSAYRGRLECFIYTIDC